MSPDIDLSTIQWSWALRATAVAVMVVLLVSATAATMAYDPADLEAGTVEREANGTTIVGIQGFHFQGEGDRKKPARLVAFNESASVSWIYEGAPAGSSWFYDVDPLPNGNVLAVNTYQESGDPKTLVYELDPETQKRVWQVKLDLHDTHDVDLINGDELLVGNMRNYDADNGTANDRVVIYDISEQINGSEEPVTEDDVVWEWYFKDHYPADTDGGMNDDWTHLNDVDKVGDGQYLASPRNFDQVILINRSTNETELQLGEDDDHDTLFEQHNPMYLETDDGKPTILVADSENDRVVEYTCTERAGDGSCEWELVWEVADIGLNWPRDADRLPNGNTLIVDSLHHRVVEVNPDGEIVWEGIARWAPYDAERMNYGDEGQRADLPTMTDLNASGEVGLTGSSGKVAGTGEAPDRFHQWLRVTFSGTPLSGPAESLAHVWQNSDWAKPAWMAPWSFVYLVFTVLLLFVWGLSELVYQRRRVASAFGSAADRVRQ